MYCFENATKLIYQIKVFFDRFYETTSIGNHCYILIDKMYLILAIQKYLAKTVLILH